MTPVERKPCTACFGTGAGRADGECSRCRGQGLEPAERLLASHPLAFTREGAKADPGAVMNAAHEHGSVTILGEDGKPHARISAQRAPGPDSRDEKIARLEDALGHANECAERNIQDRLRLEKENAQWRTANEDLKRTLGAAHEKIVAERDALARDLEEDRAMSRVITKADVDDERMWSTKLDELRALLRTVEWAGHRGWGPACCPVCEGFEPEAAKVHPSYLSRAGHQDLCGLAKAIGSGGVKREVG